MNSQLLYCPTKTQDCRIHRVNEWSERKELASYLSFALFPVYYHCQPVPTLELHICELVSSAFSVGVVSRWLGRPGLPLAPRLACSKRAWSNLSLAGVVEPSIVSCHNRGEGDIEVEVEVGFATSDARAGMDADCSTWTLAP